MREENSRFYLSLMAPLLSKIYRVLEFSICRVARDFSIEYQSATISA